MSQKLLELAFHSLTKGMLIGLLAMPLCQEASAGIGWSSSSDDWGWERREGRDRVTYLSFLGCERWKSLGRQIHAPALRINGALPHAAKCSEVNKATQRDFFPPDLPKDFAAEIMRQSPAAPAITMPRME